MADDEITAALAEIRERESKATPGPWKVSRDHGYDTDGAPWSLPSVTGPDGREILPGYVDQPGADLRFAAHARTDVPRLLAAVEVVLKPHSPRSDRVLGSSCFTHRHALNTMLPVRGCESCVQDRQREVCPECRDEYGDPVLFQDCRARSAVLAALTGKGNGHG